MNSDGYTLLLWLLLMIKFDELVNEGSFSRVYLKSMRNGSLMQRPLLPAMTESMHILDQDLVVP